jgi:hypothetical protein
MTGQSLAWILVACGIAMAFVGKRIFWLTVGLLGFALGYVISQFFVAGVQPVISLTIGVIVGLLFGWLTLRGLPVIAEVVGAILAGLAASAFMSTFTDSVWLDWLAFVVAAAVGWLLVKNGIGPAIIILTALCGGVLVTRGLQTAVPGWAHWIPLLLGLATIIGGALVQFRATNADEPGAPASSA